MNRFSLFNVKEGKLDQWKNWCHLLMTTHHTKALETLVQENSNREGYVLLTIGDTHYVLAHSTFFGEPLPANMEEPLNQEHRKNFAECLERVAVGEELCDLIVRNLT